MKKIFIVALVFLSLQSCKKNKIDEGKTDEKITEEVKPKIVKEFGYILNDYKVIRDTIKSGESFGEILNRHHIPFSSYAERTKNRRTCNLPGRRLSWADPLNDPAYRSNDLYRLVSG